MTVLSCLQEEQRKRDHEERLDRAARSASEEVEVCLVEGSFVVQMHVCKGIKCDNVLKIEAAWPKKRPVYIVVDIYETSQIK